MQTISQIVQEICRTGAGAMHRYTEVSGQDAHWEMPEHFLQAYVFDQLGDRITMTLETGIGKLVEWDGHRLQARRKLVPEDQELTVVALADDLGIPRVDLVVYEKLPDNQPKDEQGMLALVEFKKGAWALEIDRQKLQRILPYIRTCRYGIVAAACEESELSKYIDNGRNAGATCFNSPVPNHPMMKKSRFFVAWLFENMAWHQSSQ